MSKKLTLKKQTFNPSRRQTKRQTQIDINRKLSQIGKISVIVSHGEFIENDKFKIPNNIRLFQITSPTKFAYAVDLYSIVEQLFDINNKTLILKRDIKGTDVKPPPIYKSKTQNEKYRYYFPTNIEDKFKITEPGRETSNLKLDFSESPEPNSIFFKELYYAYANAIIKPKKELTLKEVLNKISIKYSDLCDAYGVDDNKYPLDIIQLSCAIGDYSDVENLVLHMEKAFNLSVENNRTECGITTDLIDIYKSTTPNIILYKSNYDDFMVWVKEKYTPIYSQNHKLMKDKYCKKNIHKRKDLQKSNSQSKKYKMNQELKSKSKSNQMDVEEN